MKKRTVIYLYLITLFSAVVFADTLPNPFTPHVFIEQVQPPMPVSSGDLIGSTQETETEEQAFVHPLKAFDALQYSVKGLVLSKDNSIVLVSAGPRKDYFVYKGDVIGRGGATITKILKDGIILMQDEKEIVIKVRNTEETSGYGY
jgi:Tfp pilus assembly protein PilP|tara:strand:- start:14 stop:451 length:438 start_codon:yes stop_codon:yes gene_type:complete